LDCNFNNSLCLNNWNSWRTELMQAIVAAAAALRNNLDSWFKRPPFSFDRLICILKQRQNKSKQHNMLTTAMLFVRNSEASLRWYNHASNQQKHPIHLSSGITGSVDIVDQCKHLPVSLLLCGTAITLDVGVLPSGFTSLFAGWK
jgi:hypothetical protein